MRVPRKLKKKFKTMWFKKLGYEFKIQRKSINFNKDNKPKWSCFAYHKKLF